MRKALEDLEKTIQRAESDIAVLQTEDDAFVDASDPKAVAEYEAMVAGDLAQLDAAIDELAGYEAQRSALLAELAGLEDRVKPEEAQPAVAHTETTLEPKPADVALSPTVEATPLATAEVTPSVSIETAQPEEAQEEEKPNREKLRAESQETAKAMEKLFDDLKKLSNEYVTWDLQRETDSLNNRRLTYQHRLDRVARKPDRFIDKYLSREEQNVGEEAATIRRENPKDGNDWMRSHYVAGGGQEDTPFYTQYKARAEMAKPHTLKRIDDFFEEQAKTYNKDYRDAAVEESIFMNDSKIRDFDDPQKTPELLRRVRIGRELMARELGISATDVDGLRRAYESQKNTWNQRDKEIYAAMSADFTRNLEVLERRYSDSVQRVTESPAYQQDMQLIQQTAEQLKPLVQKHTELQAKLAELEANEPVAKAVTLKEAA